MHFCTKAALVAAMVAALTALTPSRAFAYSSAPLTFCNKTDVKVGLAAGYHSPGVNDPADHSVLTGPFVSRGWYPVEPGSCVTVPNPFGARYMFWFAFSKAFNSDYGTLVFQRIEDGDHFCIASYFGDGSGNKVPSFTYEDENVSKDACDIAGGSHPDVSSTTEWIKATSVDTWVDATVNFTGK